MTRSGNSRRPSPVLAATGAAIVLTAALAATAAGRPALDAPPAPPLGLPAVQWPADNPYSKAKAERGRLLYFDKRLSSDGTVACASCHDPAYAFSKLIPLAIGINGQKETRNAPT